MGEFDNQGMRVLVAQKKWKGVGQCAEVSGMSKDTESVRNVMSGIQFANGVAGSTDAGIEMAVTSLGGNMVEREASVCDRKDMVPHSGKHPE